MTRKCSIPVMFLLLCTLALLATNGKVRADGDKSIARVLDGSYDEFRFFGEEGQVLFVEAKADFYQDRGRSGDSAGGCSDGGSSGCTSDHDSTTSCSDDGSSGCSGDDDINHDCSDGGSGGSFDLCLQVLDSFGDKLCWAGRPARPGWQRDPRLACPLPGDGEYILRVFVGKCGSTETTTYQHADSFDSKRFYRLFVDLMDIKEEGPIPKLKKK